MGGVGAEDFISLFLVINQTVLPFLCYIWYLTRQSFHFFGRVAMVEKAKARGENPYPHKFDVSIQLPAYVEKYGGLEAGAHLEGEPVSIAGAVYWRWGVAGVA